jgi:hypothetical protein
MKMYEEVRVYYMKVSGELPLGKEPHSIHYIGGWVSPRAGLDAVERQQSLTPAGN